MLNNGKRTGLRAGARVPFLRNLRHRARWAVVGAVVAVSATAAAVSAAAASSSAGPSALTAAQSAQASQPAQASHGTPASLGLTAGSSGEGTGGDGTPAVGSPASPSGTTVTAGSLTSTDPVAQSEGLYHLDAVAAYGGVVYLADTGHNIVEAVQNGQATVIAGTLSGYGEHGDGGKATSATLYQPMGVAVDAKGDVFIADTGDNVIREITPDGIIHRFAGNGTAGSKLAPGNALDSELYHPEGLAVTPGGDLLIADTYNNRVLAVTPSGKIAVVAGDGVRGYKGDHGVAASAELDQPTDVAVDGQGDVYIADASNNVIRRVDATTGIITTVAGDYAASKASDGLGAHSGDGGPATSAQLNDPQGIAIDSAGDLFIADTFNQAVRVVTPDGTISTPWTGLNVAYGIAVDPTQAGAVSRTVYVANDYALDTATYTTTGTTAPYGTPVLDGKQDAVWDKAPVTTILGAAQNSPISATVRVLWDDKYLYYLAEVSDSTPNANEPNTGQPGNLNLGEYNDSVEAWINWNDAADALYTNTSGDVASHYAITRSGAIGTNFYGEGVTDLSTVKYKVVSTSTGYIVEAAIPWPSGITPRTGHNVGIVFSVNDVSAPGGTSRSSYITTDTTDQYWNTPVVSPAVTLTGPAAS